MLARTLFAVYAFVSFGLVVSAPTAAPLAAVDIIQRDNADIQQILTDLKVSTDAILPQISQLATNGSASDDTVTPLVTKLTSALDQATSSMSTLTPSSPSRKRQNEAGIAILVAGIVNDITTTVGQLNQAATRIPALGGLLVGVDRSLAQVLAGLDTLLAGVLRLVANLLINVATLLRLLAFGLTLARLGLPL